MARIAGAPWAADLYAIEAEAASRLEARAEDLDVNTYAIRGRGRWTVRVYRGETCISTTRGAGGLLAVTGRALDDAAAVFTAEELAIIQAQTEKVAA